MSCPVPHTTRDAVCLAVGALGGAAISYFAFKQQPSQLPATTDTPGASPESPMKPPLQFPAYDREDDKKSFMAVGDVLIEEAVACLKPLYEMPDLEQEWIRKMLNYNVKGGKM